MAKRGPRTAEGRAAVQFNAVQHGMRALSPVVPGEEPEDWRAHLEGIEESLQPADQLEARLVERIALLLWRLRRVAAFETETLLSVVKSIEEDWEKEERGRKELAALGGFYGKSAQEAPDKEVWLRKRQAEAMIPGGATLDRVMRYEAHLHRQLLQTMHELEALQGRRQGQPTPLARLDVAGGPGR